MEGGLSGLDWSQPWYQAWRDPGERVELEVNRGRSVADALQLAGPGPVRFVPQSELPAGEPYERFIHTTGCCPTRDNLHDFFNGLTWLRLPAAKRRLNEVQAHALAQGSAPDRRGPVRDAITVFDENGLLLDAPQPLWDALLARDWRQLFVDLRPLWAQARVLIVGHALLEKLAAPRKDMTAHVWHAPAPLDSVEAADAWLAAQCTPEWLAAKPFTPLPVLGLPGWWAANENFSFYDDSVVFRPRKPEADTAAAPRRA
ncbi:DUF3025 domain-containing protein [Ramlibacter sp. MMS24-I3-19]|uniref:DUF3025 domain-containing protein n=1 Tax=Ramlibacter sp. MMS24-I3-19 TaxID=3416606 RepID=UPI003CFD8A33